MVDIKSEENFDTNKTILSNEEVNDIIKRVLDETIGNTNYSHSDCASLNQSCVENITKRLVALNKPYKYIVTSSLLQIANGSGLNVSTISYWNKATDFTYQYRWENRFLLCVTTVLVVAI